MKTLATVTPDTRGPDSATDFGLVVGESVEAVGFVTSVLIPHVTELFVVIVHPRSGRFVRVPAWLLRV